jgi:hypothetical protein
MSHGCGTVIAIIPFQKDAVRSSDPHSLIQEAAMNAESQLFQPAKIEAIYPMLGAKAFVDVLAAREQAF